MVDSSTPAPVPASLADTYNAAGKAWGVAPSLLWAIGKVESNHAMQPITSSAGAEGMQQFMPKTAAAVGMTNPQNPVQSIYASAKLMSQLLKQYGGDGRKALMAYNAGQDQSKWVPGYADNVTAAQQELLGQGAKQMAQNTNSSDSNGGYVPLTPEELSQQAGVEPQATPTPRTTASAGANPTGPASGGFVPMTPDQLQADAGVTPKGQSGWGELGSGIEKSGIELTAAPLMLGAHIADYLNHVQGLAPTNEQEQIAQLTGLPPTAVNAMRYKTQQALANADADGANSGLGILGQLGAGLPAAMGAGLAGERAVGLALGRTGIGKVLTGTAQAAPGAGWAAKGLTALGNAIGRGATQGAAQAAVLSGPQGPSGSGEAQGALAGAILNGGLHIGGATLAPIAQSLWNGASRLFSDAPDVGKQVIDTLGEKLAAAGLTPAKLAQQLMGSSSHTLLADHPAFKPLAVDVARNEGAPNAIANAAMAARLGTLHTNEIPEIIQQSFGVPKGPQSDLAQYKADVESRNNGHWEGDQFVPGAFAQTRMQMIPTPAILHNLASEGIDPFGLLARAEEAGQELRGAHVGQGIKNPAEDYSIWKGEPQEGEQAPEGVSPLKDQIPASTVADLVNYVKNLGKEAQSSGNFGKANKLVYGEAGAPSVAQQLDQSLRESVPPYAKAMEDAAGYKQAEAAHSAGMKFATQSPEEIKSFLEGTKDSQGNVVKPGLTPDQRKWYAAGAMQQMLSKLRDSAINVDQYGNFRLTGRPLNGVLKSFLAGDKVKAALGNGPEAQTMIDKLTAASQLLDNAKDFMPRKVVEAQVAPNASEHAIPAMAAAATGHGLARSLAYGAKNLLLNAAHYRSPEVNTGLAELLFNPNKAQVLAALEQLSHKPSPSAFAKSWKELGPVLATGGGSALGAAAGNSQPNPLSFLYQQPQAQRIGP